MFIFQGTLNWFEYLESETGTFIFPNDFQLGAPVYAAWQWTVDGNGKKKQNCFTVGTIDSTSLEGTTRKLAFFQDNYYRFDAVLAGDVKTLTLTMSNEGGDTVSAVDMTNVFEYFNPTDLTVPRVYLGKMTWYTYAVNEIFLIVAPGNMGFNQRICALWQWTKDSAGNTNAPACQSTLIDSMEGTSNGEKITFSHYYKFSAEVDEPGKVLKVTMINPDNDTQGPFELALQDLIPSSRRRKRALFNEETTIINGTNDILACSLTTSGATTTDVILAVLGLGLGFAGVAVAIPYVGASVLTGLFLAELSLAAGVGGAFHVFNQPDAGAAALLFRGDSLYRKSSGFSIHADNDVTVFRIVLENDGKRLVVYSYNQEKLGTMTIQLNDNWFNNIATKKKLLPIALTSEHQLLAYRILVIPSFQPVRTTNKKPLKNITQSEYHGAMVTQNDGDGEWYGSMKSYYGLSWNNDDTMFKLSTTTFELTQKSGTVTLDDSFFLVKVIKRSPVNNVSDPLVVIRLDKCKLDVKSAYPDDYTGGKDVHRTFEDRCDDEDHVHLVIRDNSAYWVYYWTEGGKVVAGLELPGDTSRPWLIKYTGNIKDHCFFKVKSWSPFQGLIPK